MGKDVKNNDNIKKSFLIAGIFLINFIIINILISTSLFIFKVSIQRWYVIASLIVTIIVQLLLMRKMKLLYKNKKTILNGIICIVLPIIIIAISIILCGKGYSFSCDGNNYHKPTIGLLTDGWNPLYENAENFVKNNAFLKIPTDGIELLWINHYARATHVFQANIYALTNNIESGRSIDIITISAVFLIIFSFLAIYFKKIIFPIIFALCAITYSVVSTQILTNYIDLHLYLYLLLLMVSFFMLHYKEDEEINKIGFIIYFISLLMLINIKFSSFAYAGIYCLGFYIYYIIKLKKKKLDKKYFIKFTIISTVAVIIGVFVIGLSVYPKNFIDHGHPFYPLYGKGKVDIMTPNEPQILNNKMSVEKYFISMFSNLDNSIITNKVSLKIPFTLTKNELDFVSIPDARLSGGGILFSGVFILSVLGIILTSKEIYKKNKEIFIYFGIILLISIMLIFVISENWWARYFPQSYFFVLTAILFTYQSKNKIKNNISIIILITLFLNNIFTINICFKDTNMANKIFNSQIEILKNKIDSPKEKIVLYASNSYYGLYYNVRDMLPKYNIEIVEKYTDHNFNENDIILNYLHYNIDD